MLSVRGFRCLASIAQLVLVVSVGLRWCNFSQAQPLSIGPLASRIELGRKLFFEPRLSVDGSTSCASCHDPAHGWADGRRVAIGRIRDGRGLPGTRNTPSIINAAFQDGPQFWDMRAKSLSDQATQPITNPIEMGQQTIGEVLRRIAHIPGYPPLFAAAFGSSEVSQPRLAAAIETFERTITSVDAPIDRLLAGESGALSAPAARGFAIFQSAGCIECHAAPMFRDGLVHNNGFAVRVAAPDPGRAAIAGNGPGGVNVRAFKTPALREVARTAPYMHDGGLPTLEAVVEHYNAGGRFVREGQTLRNALADPRVRPLGLSLEQKRDLIAFLVEGLTSSEYPQITQPVLP